MEKGQSSQANLATFLSLFPLGFVYLFATHEMHGCRQMETVRVKETFLNKLHLKITDPDPSLKIYTDKKASAPTRKPIQFFT